MFDIWAPDEADSSNRHIFAAGRIKVPLEVLTSTVRTLPSSPGKVLTTLPRGQCDREASSFFNRIKSHSLRRRHHIISVSAWATLHLLRLLISRSSSRPVELLRDARPMRKWFGVSAS